MQSDVDRIRDALSSLEEAAQNLPWADTRRWTAASHVWSENAIATVDLHDLNVKLAKKVVQHVAPLAGSLEGGAVSFITGRGHHSMGSGSNLKAAVNSELVRQCKKNDWDFRIGRAGRSIVVTDLDLAPSIATGGLPLPIIIGGLAFVGLALVFATPVGVLLLVLAAAGFAISRYKS